MAFEFVSLGASSTKDPTAISTSVEKLWKRSGSGDLTRFEGPVCAEAASAAPEGFRFTRSHRRIPRTALRDAGGIVSECSLGSKRKIREGIHRGSHTLHSFSTAPESCKSAASIAN